MDFRGLHGEHDIDKILGTRGPENVAKMGIVEHNNQCQAICEVILWKSAVRRVGQCIELDNDYNTLHPQLMELV